MWCSSSCPAQSSHLSRSLLPVHPGVAAKNFGGARRRPGSRVEQRDCQLALGERPVEYGQVADDEREHAEARPGLDDHERLPERAGGREVASPHREEGDAAQIEVA